MAVDEALLNEAATEGIATLRFYEWNEPTLSLGYFQKYADRALHHSSVESACVRRQSGGGAIMHDRELTYSLVLPRTHPLAADAQSLYDAVHMRIIAALRTQLPLSVSGDTLCMQQEALPPSPEPEPFLCFQRRAVGDILFVDQNDFRPRVTHKIVGSAQRRSRGSVLQHGSVLISRSQAGPELAGLSDLCDNTVQMTYLTSELSGQLLAAVGLEVRDRTLSDQVIALALTLRDEKYRNRFWTQRR